MNPSCTIFLNCGTPLFTTCLGPPDSRVQVFTTEVVKDDNCCSTHKKLNYFICKTNVPRGISTRRFT